MNTIQIADPAWETTFPHRVEPRPEEWLGGIFLRCDEVNGWDSGTTMTTFVRVLHLDKTARSMSLVLPPASMDLRPLAGWLAVSEQSLLATTYRAELSRLYETPHPHPQLFSAGMGVHFCPACMAHAMRNEMHIQTKWPHRPIQFSRCVLARDQNSLCLLETGK